MEHAQIIDSGAPSRSRNIAVRIAKAALWLMDPTACGCETASMLQVAALEAENARLARGKQPEASRHQVCGHPCGCCTAATVRCMTGVWLFRSHCRAS